MRVRPPDERLPSRTESKRLAGIPAAMVPAPPHKKRCRALQQVPKRNARLPRTTETRARVTPADNEKDKVRGDDRFSARPQLD